MTNTKMKNKKTLVKSLAMLLVLGTFTANTMVAAAADTPLDASDTPIPESNTVAAETDTTYPSDVENVQAVAGDQQVTLSWDAATDNLAVKGYKIFYGTQSVASDTASYTLGPIDTGDVLTYKVTGLENDQTYYFAVTAYDAAANESEFYSTEVSATPKASGTITPPAADDKVAPKVVSAIAPFKNSVKVVFSEAVKLPPSKAETAFSIKDDFLGNLLSINKAEIDSTDKSNKTVLLTTADQKKNSKYILTAGIQIQDLSGNPIVSGTSDTAVFSGTDAVDSSTLKPAATDTTPGDTTPPTFVSVKANDANTVQVTFSEPVVLLTNAAENFIITDANDNTKITDVTKVSISQNGSVATLTTADMKAQKFNLIAIKVKDTAGNLMDVQNSATTFDGMAPVEAPTDTSTTKIADAASGLVAKMVSSMMVNLSWNTKADQMASVANFVVYLSTDRGTTYGPGVVLNKDVTSYDFNNLKEDMLYYFKLTTKDASGNESEGLVSYLTLPKTGPELGLLLFGSGGLGALFTRKKKKK